MHITGFIKKSLIELLLLEIRQDLCFLVLKSLILTHFLKYFKKLAQMVIFITYQIWKKLMKRVYKNGTVTTQSLIAALAFVPPRNAFNAFEEWHEVIRNNCGIAAGIVLYFLEDTYCGRFRRNAAYSVQLFSIEMQNMFHRTN